MFPDKMRRVIETGQEYAHELDGSMVEALAYARYHLDAGRVDLARNFIQKLPDRTIADLLHQSKCNGCHMCSNEEIDGWVQRAIRI